MLVFPEVDNINMNTKHMILLEETLRIIGNFDNPRIRICDYEKLPSNDIIFSVMDKEGTTYKFYNYDVDKDMKIMTRLRKNYHIIMKRKNSNNEYTYDFFKYTDKMDEKKINIIEITTHISNTRTLTIKLTEESANQFIIEDKNKIYLYQYSNDIGFDLLEEMESLIKILGSIKNITVECVLRTFPKINKLLQCMVHEDDKRIAAICFENGNILGYELNTGLEKIKVNVSNKITRSIFYNNKLIESKPITKGNEKFKNECKRLLKEI